MSLGLLAFFLLRQSAPPPDTASAFLASTPEAVRTAAASTALAARSTPRPPPRASPRPAGSPGPTRPVVFLDPGHGGVDTGTIGTTPDGATIAEKNVALAIAKKTAADLGQDGMTVVLSRSDDQLVGASPADFTSDGSLLTPAGVLADLQRRIDRANASKADVLLSIHLNAFSDPSIGGTQTFYDGGRPFADRNKELATLVQESVINAFHANGLAVPDRGATDDQDLQAESLGTLDANYNHLVLLGPPIPGQLRASQMPGALCEVLFLSDPAEAAIASQAETEDLIASAFTSAIEQFLRG